MAVNRNLFYRADEISQADLNSLNAQLDTDAFRAKIDAINWRYHKRGRRSWSSAELSAKKDEIDRLVLDTVGGSLPNGYNVSPEGYVQFANETPFAQQAAWMATPFIAQQGVAMAANALGTAGGTGAAATSVPGVPVAAEGLHLVAAPPAVGGGGGWSLPGVAKKAWDWASGDTGQVLGNIVDWTTDYMGGRRAEGVLAEDKVAWEERYQAMLDLNATQRTEDLALDADRETALQARWEAEQTQRQTMWDAREAQMEPYRVAGHQSLAQLSKPIPTRTPYRSRFMG